MTKIGEERRATTLAYLKWFIKEFGYPPSIREIMVGLGLNSTSSVHYHLKALEQAGQIERRGPQRWIHVNSGQ